MDQTKTIVNDTYPNNGKESSPFSSGSTTTNKSLDLYCNWSPVCSQVSDIKGLTFDPMIYLYFFFFIQ